MTGGAPALLDRIEEVLRKMLSDPSPAVREAASGALDRLRTRRSVPELLKTLRGGGIEEKVRAVFAASELGGPDGTAVLLAALSDAEAQVRGAAVRALEEHPTPAVLKALVGRLPAEQGVVLGNLLEALGKSRRRELATIVLRFVDHPDAEVRGKALLAYARVAGEEALARILERAEDPSETVRAAAGRSLGDIAGG